MVNHLIRFSSLLLLSVTHIFSQSDSMCYTLQQEITELRLEIKQLHLNVESLKTKIEQLRLTASLNVNSSCSALPRDSSLVSKSTPINDKGCRITKSGKRHNSSCKYYKAKDSRPCGPNEGTACKLCGG